MFRATSTNNMLLTMAFLLTSIRVVNSFGRAAALTSQRKPGLGCVQKCPSGTMSAFTSSCSTSLLSSLSHEDEVFLSQAMDHARNAFGRTFPNPAVGCVLVRQDTKEVIGSGFHPRAGFPHAEIFALLEAAGHVPSGVAAAQAIVEDMKKNRVDGSIENSADSHLEEVSKIKELTEQYTSEGGAEQLFGDCLDSMPVTAYVTLEPCCHYGQTPPCAQSFLLSKVNRVVIGMRDPNPRVDGGGVKILEEGGVQVDMADGMATQACMDLVDSFIKRIAPKDYDNQEYSWINGAKRRALRKLAGKLKAEDGLTQVQFTGRQQEGNSVSEESDIENVELEAAWMERLDFLLWQKELVNVRLNKAVGKKKHAKILGERIAYILNAHVAQTVGHTVLLYRPGMPPFLDLDDLVEDGKADGADKENGEIE